MTNTIRHAVVPTCCRSAARLVLARPLRRQVGPQARFAHQRHQSSDESGFVGCGTLSVFAPRGIESLFQYSAGSIS